MREGAVDGVHGGGVVGVDDLVCAEAEGCFALLVWVGREVDDMSRAHLLRHLEREVAWRRKISPAIHVTI